MRSSFYRGSLPLLLGFVLLATTWAMAQTTGNPGKTSTALTDTDTDSMIIEFL